MAINILLYCDNTYLANHLQMMLGEELRKYKLFLFSNAEDALNYALQNGKKIHCVLATKDFLKEIADNNLGLSMILLADETSIDNQDTEYYSINIYQRKDRILSDLDSVLEHVGLLSVKHSSSQKTKVVSFFSTQGGAGKTTIAYLTACEAAEQGKTAYLDFQPDPCGCSLYQTRYQGRPEEALVLIQDRGSADALKSLFYQNEHDVFVLPSPESILDQATMKKEDINYLIQTLLEEGTFDFLIIDLGASLGEVEWASMENSERVAIVFGEDKMGAVRKKRLEQDPNYHTYPMAGKEIWIENRCEKELKDITDTVRFPVSGSVGRVADLKEVLTGNQAFANGCKKILDLVKK